MVKFPDAEIEDSTESMPKIPIGQTYKKNINKNVKIITQLNVLIFARLSERKSEPIEDLVFLCILLVIFKM